MGSSQLATVTALIPRTGVILPFVGREVADHLAELGRRGLSPRTIQGRRDALNRLIRHAGKPLTEITTADLHAWQNAIGILAVNTRRTYIGHAIEWYRWAQSTDRPIATDPAALTRPKPRRSVPRPIPERSLERAIATAPPMIRVWLELAAYAGLRAGEIAAVERVDVLDDAAEPALVVHGKGGTMRLVPLAPRPLASLLDFGLPRTGRLFRVPATGHPVSPRYVSAMANRHLHRVGVGDTLHSLRHRCATEALAAGANIRVVQEILGHRDLTSTQIYTAVRLGDAAAALRRIDHPLIDRPLLRPVPTEETGT